MEKSPEVSVVMAVYHREEYLRHAIESILKQTYKDVEFIIIDDASDDSTPAILKEYEEKDSRIKIITNEKNLGLTKSLNKGIKIARGKYIAKMDADDISEKNRLDAQVKCLNKVIGMRKAERVITKERLLDGNVFHHSGVMFRKDVIDKLGG